MRHHFHILGEGTARELLSNMCATCQVSFQGGCVFVQQCRSFIILYHADQCCQISGDAREIAGALDVIEELIAVQALPVSSVQEVLLTLCQYGGLPGTGDSRPRLDARVALCSVANPLLPRAACVSSFNMQSGELVQRLINTSPALGRVCYR